MNSSGRSIVCNLNENGTEGTNQPGFTGNVALYLEQRVTSTFTLLLINSHFFDYMYTSLCSANKSLGDTVDVNLNTVVCPYAIS